MAVEITPDLADELTTEVIHFVRKKYPDIETFDAMEAVSQIWSEDDETTQIVIQRPLYESYRIFAKLKHVSTKSVLAYVLKDWIEVIGQGQIEDMFGTESSMELDLLMKKIKAAVEAKAPPLPQPEKKFEN